MSITIREVARQANVSRNTVSLVFNSSPRVSPKTKEKVLEVIKKTNYHPNILAQRLSKQKTSTIGVFVRGMDFCKHLYFNQYAQILTGIGRVANSSFNYDMLLQIPQLSQRQYDYVRLFDEQKIDGAIIVFPTLDDPGIEELEKRKESTVLINAVSNELDYVGIDNIGSTSKAIEHLIGLGHKSIGMINGRMQKATGYQERFSAYKLTLQKYNLPYREELVIHADSFTVDDSETIGYEAMKRILVYKPTAVFAANDVLAVGAIKAIKAAGLNIPEDIAVVGFDDNPAVSSRVPLFTTVRQPYLELGKEAVKMLVTRIERKAITQQIKRLPGELVIRSSSKKEE